MLLLGFDVLGLLGLVGGAVAFMRNWREQRRNSQHRRGLFAILGLLGILLAVVSVFVEYPFGENDRVVGFPFAAAVFERHGDHWDDFVGPFTFPAYVGNAMVWLVLPQLMLRMARWVRMRRAA